MLRRIITNFGRMFVACLVILVPATTLLAQSLQAKLSQKADFVPVAVSPKEQLIALAQHYKIPMGIEWGFISHADSTLSLTAQPTVEAMINSILQEAPGSMMEIQNGVVSISNTSYTSDRRNFLNIRIPNFKLSNVNVFGAEWQLRFDIHRTLHPERYAEGSNGGYGEPDRGDGFNIKNISVSGSNLTVREILNAIVRENGNSLWVVELNPSKMMKDEPFFAQRSYGGDVQTHFAWRIIPLSNDDVSRSQVPNASNHTIAEDQHPETPRLQPSPQHGRKVFGSQWVDSNTP